MNFAVNAQVSKAEVIATVTKNVSVTFPADDAYQFLVDVINNAGTLASLNWMIKKVPSGNISTLAVAKRKIREAAVDYSTNPTGVGSISQDTIPYAVKKVFWDEWIQNDDVVYNAIRQAQSIMQQKGITQTSDIRVLVIMVIQKQFAMDLQDLAFNGNTAHDTNDTANKDFLRILDGFVKKAATSTNKTDLGSAAPTLNDFITHVQLIPEEYTSNYGEDYVWMMTRKTHDKLMALITARATGYGDAVIKDGKVDRIAGYPIEIVSGMMGELINPADYTEGYKGFVMLTPRSNLVPVLTQDLKYNRTGEGALALKNDATYHIIHAFMDIVIRDVQAIAYMEGTNLS